MSFIAEFELSSPILQGSFEAVPEMVSHYEDLHITPDGAAKYVFWVHGDSSDRFEHALETDPTIAEWTRLVEGGGRHLYRGTLSEVGRQAMTYPAATDHDIVFLDITITHDRVEVRARVPSRDALKAYRAACVEKEIGFHLERLYREETDDSPGQYGLTPTQRDALVRAHERGYFDEPRGTTLEELAEEFEITPSALGRRMRRAQDRLIEQTLRSDT